MRTADSDPGPRSTRWFATTCWSVVLSARAGDSPEAREALGKLCRTYWPPVLAFVRRQGSDHAEAEDITQEFFARLLERNYLSRLVDQRGKFRSFLLTFLNHFLSEHRRKARAQKRGGGQALIPLDATEGDAGYLNEVVDHLTPSQVFERRWAQAVLQTALNRLREEYTGRGQAALYRLLEENQPGAASSRSYAELGAELGMTESAIKSAVHRLRQRHRELLREEIAQTVARPEEIEDELRHFRMILNT